MIINFFLLSKNMILFPERQKIKKDSIYFFKNVDLKNPNLSRVKFFVESESYFSAYIYLTKYVKDCDYFTQLLNQILDDLKDYEIDKGFLDDFKIENTIDLLDKKQVNNLIIVSKLLGELIHRYNDNSLSGKDAYELWNIIFKVYEYSYKHRKNNLYNNACIKLVSSLNIFKKSYKYKRKAYKYYKKNKNKIKDKTIKKIFEL